MMVMEHVRLNSGVCVCRILTWESKIRGIKSGDRHCRESVAVGPHPDRCVIVPLPLNGRGLAMVGGGEII